MILRVVKTTDGKHVGKTFTVPMVDYQVAHALGMNPDEIRWDRDGACCILRNSNYTIKLEKLAD